MLNESSNSAVSTAVANVGLTAFQIAVVQAKVFKKTLEDVSNRAEQTAKALERKAVERQQEVRDRLAKERGGVDFVVDGSGAPNANAANTDSKAGSPAPNGGVDITV